jgi:hypothetical protein
MIFGSLDEYSATRFTGWLTHPYSRLDTPLELWDGNQKITQTLPTDFRQDLVNEVRDGHHGFTFKGIDFCDLNQPALFMAGKLINLNASEPFIKAKQVNPQLSRFSWRPKSNPNLGSLKVFIVATPKCGNVWLKSLLGFTYKIPIGGAPSVFSPHDYESWPRQWVTHQHLPLTVEFLDWAYNKNISLVSIVRHPADMFISLFDYVKHLPIDDTRHPLETAMRSDGSQMGKNALEFIKSGKLSELLSISLIAAKKNIFCLPYELLYSDPLAYMTNLTGHLVKIESQRIRAGVDLANAENLKCAPHVDKFHIVRAKPANWATLPPTLLDALKSDTVVAEYNRLFGYTFDACVQPRRYQSTSPFLAAQTFDNGVPVSYDAIQLYFQNESLHSAWGDPIKTRHKDSFFSWYARHQLKSQRLK